MPDVIRVSRVSTSRRCGGDRGGGCYGADLDVQRDWGWAPNYVDAVVRAIRRDRADDSVVPLGRHDPSATSWAQRSRACGSTTGAPSADPALLRPAEVNLLVGDSTKARRDLGWTPAVRFEEIIGRMVDHDVASSDR